MMICKKCGQKLPEDSRFCENCGAPVNEEPPNTVPGIPQSNQQGFPGVVMGADSSNVGYSPNQQNPKKSKKTGVWIILIALIILICLCAAVTGGGFIYLRNHNLTLKDLFSKGLENQQSAPAGSITAPIPEEGAQIVPQVETPETQSDVWADTILAVTSSGVWAVNGQTSEANQISYDQVDAPWDLNEGMSPDKKYFAYITGLRGTSTNPMLVVLDIENQTSILQLELTGTIIQAGMEGYVEDPAFEAFRAMQFSGSIAWSPDGTQLAFVAARDANSADAYLFNIVDKSVTHLSEEAGHAYGLNWSPDGQLLEYLSVISFGTGGGFRMESLWVYDFQENQSQLLENLTSGGETFLAWTDNGHFLIASTDSWCETYNLRLVNAARSFNEVIVEGCFSGIAYDPEQKHGMFAVTEWNYENCTCGEALDPGLMIFGEEIGYPAAGEIGWKKFEQLDAYTVSFVPQGNLFNIYGYDEQQYIYDVSLAKKEIPTEVYQFYPFPSPTGDYWAWAARNKTGLWITENYSNPVELSPNFSGVPLWSLDGKIIYFFENDQLFSASAPQFNVNQMAEFPGEEILGLIK